MTTSQSTAGAGRRWRIFSVSLMISPGAETIRLEQNYRSTSNILSAANALIENNNGRLGKKLWTDGADGEPISLYCAFNELDEARFVVNRIKTLAGQRRSACRVRHSLPQQRPVAGARRGVIAGQYAVPYLRRNAASSNARKSKMRSRICA
ncbi:DNA helicase II [Escherichia coli]|nr:DNA helicase II [Escherichia coli]